MIIDHKKIIKAIELGSKETCIEKILKKTKPGNGLTAIETSTLFQQLDKTRLEGTKKIAEKVRIKTKGQKANLYTCLYITNKCINNCPYCGFNQTSKIKRVTLTPDEIEQEANAIQKLGIKNVILIGGSLPEKQYENTIIAGTKIAVEKGMIPWIEFENLSVQTLIELKKIGANHFVLFQETYNKTIFNKLHFNNALKNDYDKRLEMIDTAIIAGFQNITIGSLLGLTKNYLLELIGLRQHAQYLQNKSVNVTIALPTLKNHNSNFNENDFKKFIIILRLALPKVSLALSGRETEKLRNELFDVVDFIGTGGVPNPGGRTSYRENYKQGDSQFSLSDNRTPEEVKEYLRKQGRII